ncbi:Transglycosylase SLT domain-containing protein [Epibacterium ulvae]|uniref:Transglycosylase SLT domain-containing protein n=2 Tax=Epibacterium ulvae TaxID=1156985 RepID=A0A1G5RI33_9RHOB|nr:Transglycosylase SLT domain-containing protein [Epibacterium ulvae]
MGVAATSDCSLFSLGCSNITENSVREAKSWSTKITGFPPLNRAGKGALRHLLDHWRTPKWIKLLAASSCVVVSSHSTAFAEKITPEAFFVLAENCAPSVAPEIMAKIVRAESGFKRFAIGVNGANRKSYSPKNREEATQVARKLIAQGHSIDMGLGQINNANLEWLNLTVETVFDSCTNLTAAEAVLRDGYDRARKQGSDPQTALHQALSAYNTGTFTRGFTNGYVERVMGGDIETLVTTQPKPASSSTPEDTIPTWDVFATGSNSSALVFN